MGACKCACVVERWIAREIGFIKGRKASRSMQQVPCLPACLKGLQIYVPIILHIDRLLLVHTRWN